MSSSPSKQDIQDRLLAFLKKSGSEGLRKTELRRHLGLQQPQQVTDFRDIFRELVNSGAVIRQQRGRYILPAEADVTVGRLSVHHRGFGFVTREDGEQDIFIPPSGMGTALSGDLVQVVLEEETERGIAGRIAHIVERGTDTVTGELVLQDDDMFIRPLRRDFPEFIPLTGRVGKTDAKTPEHGDWVVARLLHAEQKGQPLRAQLLHRLNAGVNLTDDLDAIVSEFDLHPPYGPKDLEYATTLKPVDVKRVDRRDLTIFTIDPVDAKDFDDAVSLEPGEQEGTVILGVHIADVAAYVPAGSYLDGEARKRSFTAYLPGRTLPMLPKPLAAEICSLREGVERPAHSVFMVVDAQTGKVLRSDRMRTLIRVAKRLTFDDVQAFVDGGSPASITPAIGDKLRKLLDLQSVMRDRRASDEQFLELATVEVRVVCEENPPIIRGLKREEPNESHELVEEFMLAANVAVANELRKRKVPGIFRTHPEPQEEDLQTFRTWVKSALDLRPGKLTGRNAVNKFLESVGDRRIRDVVNTAFLRALPRAGYSHKMELHYGLGKHCYSHFTSPIRRYSDLVVHQQLLEVDRGGQPRSLEACAEIAKACTEIEANNDQAYYAALDRIKLRYIRQLQEAGEKLSYEGVIARLLPEALLVHIPEFGLFGAVPKELLGNERFHFSPERHEVRGSRSGKTYRCGNIIHVRIEKADIVKGALLLRPDRG